MEPGLYLWAARVTDGTDTFTVGIGELRVSRDLATAEHGDAQSHAERMVELIESELEARILGKGSAHGAYMIHNRQMQKIPILELKQLLGHYRAELTRLRHPNSLGRRVVSRFRVPSSG